MHYDDFIKQVQTIADILSVKDAEKAVEASLSTLGERLTGTEISELGAQLPVQLKKYLVEQSDLDRFSLDEFYNRVAARADLGRPSAIKRANAAMQTLKMAISPGLFRQMLEMLPIEYRVLFESSVNE